MRVRSNTTQPTTPRSIAENDFKQRGRSGNGQMAVICILSFVVLIGFCFVNIENMQTMSRLVQGSLSKTTINRDTIDEGMKSTVTFSGPSKAPLEEERSCIAHLLCRGCSNATDFQKKPPSNLETSCRSLLDAIATANATMRSLASDLCISEAFCDNTAPLQEGLRSGRIKFPSTTKRLWIDAGSDETTFCSRFAWEEVRWSNNVSTCHEFKSSKDLSSFAIDANTGWYPKLKLMLDKVVPVPSALGLENSVIVFNHYNSPECSSLHKPNPNVIITRKCKIVSRRELVPMLRLDFLLDMVDPDLRIEFLKIDVQGSDLITAQSMGRHLHRVEKVFIEVQEDNATLLAVGQPTKSHVMAWFEENGFRLNETQSSIQNAGIGEWNLMFDKQ